MYIGQDFTPADQSESEYYSLDFVNDIGSGQTLASAVMTCAVSKISDGTDPTPSARIIAGPYIVGTEVRFLFAGGLPNVTYTVKVDATTNLNYVLSLFSHIPVDGVY